METCSLTAREARAPESGCGRGSPPQRLSQILFLTLPASWGAAVSWLEATSLQSSLLSSQNFPLVVVCVLRHPLPLTYKETYDCVQGPSDIHSLAT